MKKQEPTVVMKSMNEVFEIMKQQIKPKPMRKPKQTLAALLNECDTISEAKALIPIWLENKRYKIKEKKFTAANVGAEYSYARGKQDGMNQTVDEVLNILK